MRKNLKWFRVIEKCLTQQQMADRLGYDRTSYNKIETGKWTLSPKFCKKLKETFDLNDEKIKEILGE